MGMKDLHKVLKGALWMDMIDFLHNRVRPPSLKERGIKDILCYPKRGGTPESPF